MVPVDIYPAERVAKALLNGAEGGLYHIPSPDPVINAMSSSMAGVSPRAYPLIECMLLPLFGPPCPTLMLNICRRPAERVQPWRR